MARAYSIPAWRRASRQWTLPGLFLLSLLGRPEAVSSQGEDTPKPIAEIGVPRFSLFQAFPTLTGPARQGSYAGAVGTRAAWLGFETGEGEVWIHPLKIARNLRLSFKIPQYSEPIPGARVARTVQVAPGHISTTYSHAAFVVRQHVLAPRDLPGILILLEADQVSDLDVHVEFQPVLQMAWPGGFGGQNLHWDQGTRAFILSESLRERNAIIGSPWATQASAHPAHRLGEAPSEFVIPVDPERAKEEFIPIVITGGIGPREEILETYREILTTPPGIMEDVRAWAAMEVRRKLEVFVSGSPVDVSSALNWAKLNLAEQRVCNPDLGCGFVAGWGPSGTSFRPGFGWFFGGDAAINSLAMSATGQWTDVAEALRFLAGYQRGDGKIPHEISQAAGHIPWFEEYPYAYYHADTTPFWMLALWSYWRASGDDELLRELWPAFQKAFQWCLTVETDGDGIIENTTGGLGAIEVGGLGVGIHQDIHLAAVWVTALQGAVEMAPAMSDQGTAAEARGLLESARASLNREYWREDLGHHAFGILQNGGTNDNLTAWPGTALAFNLLEEGAAEGTLRHLAREAISSNWGARLLSTESELFDPLHYNNGAVWPFMTGFLAWGQYRYRRPWAGYPLLEALWALNEEWSLGRHPENLSGAFNQTLDATVPHQFFASSMLVTPFARGMLGWDPDAPNRRATLAPQPPFGWREFSVGPLPVGESGITMHYHRGPQSVRVELTVDGPPVELTYIQPIPLGARNVRSGGSLESGTGHQRVGRHDIQHETTLTLSENREVRMEYSWEGGLEVLLIPAPPPAPGGSSGGLRILDFIREGPEWILTVEGDGGEDVAVSLLGESVEASVRDVGSTALSGGVTLLKIPLPATGDRVTRTVRLRATENPGGQAGS